MAGGTGARSGHVQALSRALALLNALAETGGDGAPLSELAATVGLPASTAHRLLTTLQQDRYVRFDPDRVVWSIGVQAFAVGHAFLRSRSLSATARPRMRALMEQWAETANLAVEDDGMAVYLAQVECRQMMRTLCAPGHRVPLHCSGVGKALLLGSDGAERDRMLGTTEPLARLTDKTLVERAALETDLAAAMARGWVIDDEEHSIGLRCVAAPILDETGFAAGAVSLSGPAARLPDARLAEMGAAVAEAARAITADYGGRVE